LAVLGFIGSISVPGVLAALAAYRTYESTARRLAEETQEDYMLVAALKAFIDAHIYQYDVDDAQFAACTAFAQIGHGWPPAPEILQRWNGEVTLPFVRCHGRWGKHTPQLPASDPYNIAQHLQQHADTFFPEVQPKKETDGSETVKTVLVVGDSHVSQNGQRGSLPGWLQAMLPEEYLVYSLGVSGASPLSLKQKLELIMGSTKKPDVVIYVPDVTTDSTEMEKEKQHIPADRSMQFTGQGEFVDFLTKKTYGIPNGQIWKGLLGEPPLIAYAQANQPERQKLLDAYVEIAKMLPAGSLFFIPPNFQFDHSQFAWVNDNFVKPLQAALDAANQAIPVHNATALYDGTQFNPTHHAKMAFNAVIAQTLAEKLTGSKPDAKVTAAAQTTANTVLELTRALLRQIKTTQGL
jgi:hypothetical protein